MIHKLSIISPKAKIGKNVVIGPFTIIHPNVIIGDGTTIESYCEIGYPCSTLKKSPPLIIGAGSLIRSHSTFYEGSIFGDNLVTGHRVTVREKTSAGLNLQIGTLSDIQGYCDIGNFVRLHSNVHIGQQSAIKDYVWIFPYVVLTNDPHPPSDIRLGVTVNKYTAIGTMSVILPGVNIGEGALIAAHSSVSKDVQQDTVVAGSPAKFICNTQKIKLKNSTDEDAYPWRKHFHRGYPNDIVEKWLKEFQKN